MNFASERHQPELQPDSLGQGDALAEAAADLGAECARRYASLMRDLVQRLFGDDEALSRQALESCSFSLDSQTVVMRLDAETDMVEFFCDMGQPDFKQVEASYRNLLEFNLCRSYPGLVFGVHPESGRIVATCSMHVLMLTSVDLCCGVLQTMIDCVKAVIAEGAVVLE